MQSLGVPPEMAREKMRIHVNDEIPDAKAHVCFVVMTGQSVHGFFCFSVSIAVTYSSISSWTRIYLQ